MRESNDFSVNITVILKPFIEFDQLRMHGLKRRSNQSVQFWGEIDEIQFGFNGLDLSQFCQKDAHIIGVLLAHEQCKVQKTQWFVAILFQNESS